MTGIRELQDTFEAHAHLAPDGAGIVAAAEAGAARVRRRRLHLGIGATVVAAIAALVPVAATRGPTVPRPAPQHLPAQPPYRAALALTVDLAADGPYVKLEYGAWGTTQVILARPANQNPGPGATIMVHDPGTFDAARFTHGERVTVQGHEAYFVPDYILGTELGLPPGTAGDRHVIVGTSAPPGFTEIPTPAVGWPDASGAWVVVLDGGDKAKLLHVAEAVRLGAPRMVPAPFRLGYVPAGLPGAYIRARHVGMNNATLGLGTVDDMSNPRSFVTVPKGIPLAVSAFAHGDYVDGHVADLGAAPTKVAGLDTWYLTASDRGWGVADGAAVLVVNTPHCVVLIGVADRNRVPYPELKRIVEGADFRNCADERTWTAPLS